MSQWVVIVVIATIIVAVVATTAIVSGSRGILGWQYVTLLLWNLSCSHFMNEKMLVIYFYYSTITDIHLSHVTHTGVPFV
jgi:hypothetical protein